MTPTLPIDAIRRALDAGEWDMAASLIAGHEREVREALETPGGSADGLQPDRSAWVTLLSQQRLLLEQLKSARSETSDSLRRLQDNRRGAQAYLAGAGG